MSAEHPIGNLDELTAVQIAERLAKRVTGNWRQAFSQIYPVIEHLKGAGPDPGHATTHRPHAGAVSVTGETAVVQEDTPEAEPEHESAPKPARHVPHASPRPRRK